jgi:hypothetical protein
MILIESVALSSKCLPVRVACPKMLFFMSSAYLFSTTVGLISLKILDLTHMLLNIPALCIRRKPLTILQFFHQFLQGTP